MSRQWTAPGSNAPLLFSGRLQFEDVTTPVSGKDEWGLDTLERTVRGPIFMFEDYAAALRQGAIFKGYYLQSWRPIEHPFAPGFSLTYKGVQAGIPDPFPNNSRCEILSSISAEKLSISHAGKRIISATREIKYISPQTNYRYISESEPQATKYGAVRGIKTNEVQVIDSRIIASYDDGTTQPFVGIAPAALATALFVTPSVFVIGPSATKVFGTPYWECEEVCQLRFPER